MIALAGWLEGLVPALGWTLANFLWQGALVALGLQVVLKACGALTGCTADPDEPDSLGFSAAAARLASAMRMNLWSADAAPVQGGVVHVPIRLNLKGG